MGLSLHASLIAVIIECVALAYQDFDWLIGRVHFVLLSHFMLLLSTPSCSNPILGMVDLGELLLISGEIIPNCLSNRNHQFLPLWQTSPLLLLDHLQLRSL